MLRTFAVVVETAAIALLGGMALISNAADGAVVAALLSGISAILVAVLKRDGNQRSAALARIEASTEAMSAKVDRNHGDLLELTRTISERVAALEALRPVAEERGQRLMQLEQSVAQLWARKDNP